jgi:putative hydrolase of the HAD superfamily
MRFDAVAFDLDGTLYPARRIYALALLHMLPIARRLEAFNAARRQLRAQGRDATRRPGSTKPACGEAFHRSEARLIAERLGLEETETRVMMERCFYAEVEELFARVRPYAGLASALRRIEGAGLRLALLSDLPPLRKLELMGLAGRFDPALCSEDSGFLKPAREPFEMLIARLGLPPSRILYVGNSLSIDVAGAKAAGMSAAIISRRHVKEADLSFSNWENLADFALAD